MLTAFHRLCTCNRHNQVKSILHIKKGKKNRFYLKKKKKQELKFGITFLQVHKDKSLKVFGSEEKYVTRIKYVKLG